MKCSRCFAVAAAALAVILALRWQAIAGEDRSAMAAEEAAIRQASANYVEARKQGNAEALAAFWTAEGVYRDVDGRECNARDLISEGLRVKTVRQPPAREKLESTSTIRFITTDVAVEEGVIRSTDARDAESIDGGFTATWVKKDRRWLLDSVREWPAPANVPDNRLDALAWMIGDQPVGRSERRTQFLEQKREAERRLDLPRHQP